MKFQRRTCRIEYSGYLLASILYFGALLFSIRTFQGNTRFTDRIQPYIYGSEPIDFFFPLFVTVPFCWEFFYLKNNHFLRNVANRINVSKYLSQRKIKALTACFFMVFISNLLAIVVSLATTVRISQEMPSSLLSFSLGGVMQVNHPMLFGLIWSLYKALLACLICYAGQLVVLHVKNIFAALLAPFIFIVLENFTTAIFRLSRFSITTAFILNRLSPAAMQIRYIALTLSVYFVLVGLVALSIRKRNEKIYL